MLGGFETGRSESFMKLTEPQSLMLHSIRGLSAVIVLVGHAFSVLKVPPPIGSTIPVQTYAISIFFLLSGFLIAYQCLSRDESYSFTEYLVDRFARIFVVFIPVLVLVAVADVLYTGRARLDVASAQTFLANVLMLHYTPFDMLTGWAPKFEPFGSGRPFWTIAGEWWLYVMFGMLFFAHRMTIGEKMLAGLVLLTPALLVVLYFTIGIGFGFAWIAGAALALIHRYVPKVDHFVGPAAFFLVPLVGYQFAVLPTGAIISPYDVAFLCLQAFIFGCMLFLSDRKLLAAFLIRTRGLWIWLAAVSYSLYLTHYTILLGWLKAVGRPLEWKDLPLFFAVSMLAAWAATWAFDRHHRTVARWIKGRISRPALPQQELALNRP
jgi:peptidoglycan/LPS O-acetylase OafA/YrhL